jgi:tRNA threonylcarbamoyl adenosine modification protein (Sua5/YciO/YrdC/YwlC family)
VRDAGDPPDQAAAALRRGELILLPTETVYGLGADAADPRAVAAIFEAKGRPRFNPLIAHVSDAAAAEAIGLFDAAARALAQAFWPGPMTLVVPVRDRTRVCDLARAGLDSVAVRVPGPAQARAVLSMFGGPVVAPSANRSGRPSPTTFADAVEEQAAPDPAEVAAAARDPAAIAAWAPPPPLHLKSCQYIPRNVIGLPFPSRGTYFRLSTTRTAVRPRPVRGTAHGKQYLCASTQ